MTDSEFEEKELEIDDLFAGGRLEPAPPDDSRIDRIVDKALYESVLKDTTNFVISSFSSAIVGLTGALLSVADQPKDQEFSKPKNERTTL